MLDVEALLDVVLAGGRAGGDIQVAQQKGLDARDAQLLGALVGDAAKAVVDDVQLRSQPRGTLTIFRFRVISPHKNVASDLLSSHASYYRAFFLPGQWVKGRYGVDFFEGIW